MAGGKQGPLWDALMAVGVLGAAIAAPEVLPGLFAGGGEAAGAGAAGAAGSVGAAGVGAADFAAATGALSDMAAAEAVPISAEDQALMADALGGYSTMGASSPAETFAAMAGGPKPPQSWLDKLWDFTKPKSLADALTMAGAAQKLIPHRPDLKAPGNLPLQVTGGPRAQGMMPPMTFDPSRAIVPNPLGKNRGMDLQAILALLQGGGR